MNKRSSVVLLATNDLRCLGAFSFPVWGSLFQFCYGDILAAQGTFLMLKTQIPSICYARNCSVDDLLYSATNAKSNFRTELVSF